MMRMFGRALWALAIVGATATAACSKKADDAATPAPVPSGSAAPSAAPQAAAGSAPSQPTVAGGGLASTLSDRLVKEAQNRPAIQPNADDVLAAFAKIGGGVTAKKQGLGATYKASFCEGGTTSDGAVTVSICEYPDDASSKDGLTALQTIYPAKQAMHVLHKDTVLTTLRLQDGPAAQTLETKLIAAYKAL